MASTNHTANYNLSQFVGTDKPAWLGDYNSDMSKIDAGIAGAASTATGADGKADTANTAIGTLSSLTTTTKTDLVSAVNEVNTLAGTANTAAGTALSTANAAGNKADTAISGLNRFNLTNHSTLTPSTDKGSLVAAYSYVKFSTDSSSSIFKVYGRLSINFSGATGPVNVTLGTTTLRPSAAYSINAGALVVRTYNDNNTSIIPISINVATNGVISLEALNVDSITNFTIYLPPCLYFNTDFGDQA